MCSLPQDYGSAHIIWDHVWLFSPLLSAFGFADLYLYIFCGNAAKKVSALVRIVAFTAPNTNEVLNY